MITATAVAIALVIVSVVVFLIGTVVGTVFDYYDYKHGHLGWALLPSPARLLWRWCHRHSFVEEFRKGEGEGHGEGHGEGNALRVCTGPENERRCPRL